MTDIINNKFIAGKYFHKNTNKYWRNKALIHLRDFIAKGSTLKDDMRFHHSITTIDAKTLDLRIESGVNLPRVLNNCRYNTKRYLNYYKRSKFSFYHDYQKREKELGVHKSNLTWRLSLYRRNLYKPCQEIRFSISPIGFSYYNLL